MKAARIALVAVSLLALVSAACGTDGGGPGRSATPSAQSSQPSAGPDNGAYAGAEVVIDVAEGPRGVAFADGSIWVASTIGDVIQRVDPADNTVIAEIPAHRPVTLVTVGDELWASVLNGEPSSDDEIVRIDTDTDAISVIVDVPVFHNIAAGGGLIWAVDEAGILRQLDPTTRLIESAGSSGGKTIAIAASDEAIFGIREDGVAWRRPIGGGALLDASLGIVVPGRSRTAVRPGPGSSLWVAVPGTVLALDPADLSVRTRLSLPGMELVNDLWVTGTDVWLSANVTDAALGLDGGAVLRLDPETAEVTATYRLGPESSGVVDGAGSIWAVDQSDNKLARFRLP